MPSNPPIIISFPLGDTKIFHQDLDQHLSIFHLCQFWGAAKCKICKMIYFSNTMRFVLILQRNMDCTERKEDFVVYCHRRAKDYACIASRIGKKLQV